MKTKKSTPKPNHRLPPIHTNYLRSANQRCPSKKAVDQIKMILNDEGIDLKNVDNIKYLRDTKLEDYSESMDNLFKVYKTDGNQTKHDYDSLNTVTEEDQSFISNTFRRNKLNDLYHSRITIQKEEFKNPFQSKNVINKNKFIESFIKDLNTSRGLVLKSQQSKEIWRQLELKKRKHGFRKMNLLPKAAKDAMGLSKRTSSSSFKNMPNNQVNIEINETFEMQAHEVNPKGVLPEAREQFRSVYIGNGEMLIFGGLQSSIKADIWVFNLGLKKWKKMFPEGEEVTPRAGHSVIYYNRKVYFFGGLSKRLNYRFHPDLEEYNLERNEIKTYNLKTKLYLKIPRNHVAVLIGNQMLLHGGYNEDDKVMNDTACLTLLPLKWSSILISGDNPGPFLAEHSACFVAPYDMRNSPKISLYYLPETSNMKKNQSKITCKGIYMFGGRDSQGEIKNDLWVLQIGKKPLEYIKMSTTGPKPTPRYNAIMEFFEPGNYIIVHGGRNDFVSDSFALNDTWLFDLYELVWREVRVYPAVGYDPLTERCGHSSMVVRNQLLIFGGMNSREYFGNKFTFIGLDFQFTNNVDVKAETPVKKDKPKKSTKFRIQD